MFHAAHASPCSPYNGLIVNTLSLPARQIQKPHQCPEATNYDSIHPSGVSFTYEHKQDANPGLWRKKKVLCMDFKYNQGSSLKEIYICIYNRFTVNENSKHIVYVFQGRTVRVHPTIKHTGRRLIKNLKTTVKVLSRKEPYRSWDAAVTRDDSAAVLTTAIASFSQQCCREPCTVVHYCIQMQNYFLWQSVKSFKFSFQGNATPAEIQKCGSQA